MADVQVKTANIYDKYHTVELDGLGTRYGQYVEAGTYSIYNDTNNTIYWFVNNGVGRFTACAAHTTATVQLSGSYNNFGFYMPYNDDSLGDITVVQGSTVPDHYIPYWQHSLRKLTTATEAVENPLYSDGSPITAYTLKGNEEHTGTPSPSNPVMPNGVGERTENLYNDSDTAWTVGTLDDNGQPTGSTTSHYTTNFTAVKAQTAYTLNGTIYKDTGQIISNRVYYYDSSKNWISRSDATSARLKNFTTPANCAYIRVQVRIDIDSGADWNLVEGTYTEQTIPNYEPFGYKIPISSGQQTIDIYIGDLPLLKSLDGTAVDEISNSTLTRRVDADGSVLPTPITTQITMPSIPTTEGANSITVDTTVQPSEFTATWTGWHDASVKEYDGSDWS